MHNNIPIFLSSDNNYAPFVATTIASICDNTTSFCEFYILDGGISQENQEKILSLQKTFKNFSIDFLHINTEEEFSEIDYKNSMNYISISTYNRFLIPKLKGDLTKALYLDVDIIADGDISELFNEELEDYSLGAIPELWVKKELTDKRMQNLDLNKNYNYFNAGILLFNPKKWKKLNILEEIIKLEKNYRNKIVSADQDILNIYFNKNNGYKELDSKYNCLTTYMECYEFNRPIIYHYASRTKPWEINPSAKIDTLFPKLDLFWKYAKMTLFYDELKEKTEDENKQDKYIRLLRVRNLINKTKKS